LQIADAKLLPQMDGASKLAEMTGPDQPWTTAVDTEGLVTGVDRKKGFAFPNVLTTSGIRTGRYKLIEYASGEAEFYDLLTDPNELNSIWNDPRYARLQKEMIQLWQQYRSCAQAACQVPLPKDMWTTPEWLATQFNHAEAEKRAYYDN
jgi:N-acetylglucosamine-6-sulfatase